MIRTVHVPDVDDLAKARERVSAVLRPTPLDTTGNIWLKLETAQPSGSFKVRGAIAAMQDLPSDVEVVTASAGNHGLGVATATALLGTRATVVVSGHASSVKVSKLQAFDSVELIQVGTTYDEAEQHALTLTHGVFVSPYNDPAVIAGQGTIGYELDAQVDGPMTVVCAVGGGGLASGLGLWASQRPDVRIVGVESAESVAMSETIKAGHEVEITVGDTIADGITGNLEPGSVTVGLIKKHVHSLVQVTEAELHHAIRYLASNHGVIAEGAGAVSVAALLAGKVDVVGQPVAVVSGRNIALPVLAKILA
ncbi:pyridoxal-phosphate dependent enzyme [Kibdelosporangium philippinense]|uniref:Pyridoxal-phosphate dependent enzyme n=1 Tax=Kibdelosporangium philippinense TaxID=211113 RepID=A0ABS8Z8P6_9PSEU|nr:pyridoxal-phosphate dependent enzyme [Kibdelosporangium philippinense]MCE7002928.1 pyridoxal-phosphate dependent enzyme [Kibdelosporangium philippinense]